MSKTKPIFVIIDGNSFIHRSFHAIPPLSNSKGFPTNAITGTLNMINGIRNNLKPDKIVVAFDAKGKNFRHEMFTDYKANRPPTNPELKKQFEAVKKLIEAWGIPIICVDGVEADDSMSSLALLAKSAGYLVILGTSDKDMKQVVCDEILMLDTKDVESGAEPYGVEGVFQREGVYPNKIIDKLALMGDVSDNIPGVAGCGDKTAVKWINQYGSLQGVIENSDSIKGVVGENLRNSLEQLKLSEKLVTIKTDVIFDKSPDEFEINYNEQLFINLLNEYELNRFKKTIGLGNIVDQTVEQLNFDVSNVFPFDEFYEKNIVFMDVFNIEDENYYFVTQKNKETVYYFSESDGLDYLKFVMANKVKLCSFNGKELLKEISKATGIEISHNHVVHDVRVAEYVALGGKSSESSISQLNDKICKVTLSPLRSTYKLDDNTPQYKKMSKEEIIKVKTEETALCAAIFAKKVLYKKDSKSEEIILVNESERELSSEIFEKKALDTSSDSYKLDSKIIPILAKMELCGIKIDIKKLNELGFEFNERLDILKNEIYQIAGQEFNISSPKQVGEILFDVLQIPSKKKSTAENVLEPLKEDYPIVNLILNFRSLSKLLSTYVDGLISRASYFERVHTTYKQTVTSTGRLSSIDPNLQNIPIKTNDGKRIRSAFIASKGKKLLALDYSQIELRILAHLANEKNLINAFNSNIDIHKATAAKVMGITLDEVTDDFRRSAKAINFGLIYGMSANSLAKEIGVSAKEAKVYYSNYFVEFDMVKPYFEEVLVSAKENLYVETAFGRKLNVKDVNASNSFVRSHAELSAKNAPIQGTASDIIKMAMLSVAKFLSENIYDANLLLQVHDELVFEVNENIVDEFALKIQEIMMNVVELKVPLLVDYEISDTY